MTKNTFFASDHHFGHANILTFTDSQGKPTRVFDSVDAMNEHMIDRHNSVVKNGDTVWFLGDVVINRRFLPLIQRLNGRKRLVMGNHDIFKNKDYYAAGFEDLHAFRKFDGFVATHIPVHRESLRPSWGVNVHGHLHTNRVMDSSGVVDPDYICVCVEQLKDYTPVSIDDLRKQFEK
jgi:calcineurin-like phosphoesterase family protein